MNKKLSITLLVLLVGVVLMSVNFASVAQETTEISMSVWGMPFEDYLYTDVTIPKFEKKNPNVRVRFNRYEDYWTKLVVLFAGGEAPDVMRNDHRFMGLHAAKGMVYPLDEFINGPDGIDMSDFNPLPFQIYEYLGYTSFLPTDINNLDVLFYNKALFDQAGTSYPNYDWTLNDLESAAKKIAGGAKYGFFWGVSQHFFYDMIWKMGGRTFHPENPEKLLIDSPEAIKAVKLMQKWIFDDKIVPKIGTKAGGETSVRLFVSDRLGMFAHGGWMIAALKRDAPRLDFGVTVFPRRNKNTNPGCIAAGCDYFMNKNTKHPKEAWKLLKALTSEEGIMDYWQAIYVSTPARYSVLNSAKFKIPRGLKDKIPGIRDEEEYVEKIKWHKDVMENKWFDIETYNGRYGYLLFNLITPVCDKLIGTQRGDPETVLKEAVKEFSRQVEEAKK